MVSVDPAVFIPTKFDAFSNVQSPSWKFFPSASPPHSCRPHDSQHDSQLEEAFSRAPCPSWIKTPSFCWWASLPLLFPTANLSILLNGITAMKYDFLPVGNRNFAMFC